MTPAQGWQFWIDRGGTFTDVVARNPAGELRTLKLLSENPQQYADAAVHAMQRLLHEAGGRQHVAAVKMGTTVGTNALLERRGEPTLLVVTAGFADALRIGQQNRPDIFALDIRLPEMLYAQVVEAHERVSAQGEVLTALDEPRLAADLRAARAAGLASVAIVLLHGYRHPAHERRCAELAAALGFSQISVSHEVSPLLGYVRRGDTTLVDAYLSPVLRRYVAQLETGLAALTVTPRLFFMQSHGGLSPAEQFRGKDSLLSGPAGGVVGMVAGARAAGLHRLIGFDMGGTSTDVSLFDGEFERTEASIIDGIRVAAPMLRIETVAAGGGSMLRFMDGRLQVGPQSAGAKPGPACYRNGGPLTVTDANVLLGRIQPDFFPRVFGSQGDQPIAAGLVRTRFAELCAEIERATGQAFEPDRLALGFLTIAIERMAQAIRRISVQRGHDATAFSLCCLGGAAGQHACQVADELGIETIWLHPLAGVLSAYGIGRADLGLLKQCSVERVLAPGACADIDARFRSLERQARAELEAPGVPGSALTIRRRALLKLEGTDAALKLPWSTEGPTEGPAEARAERVGVAFQEAYRSHFGFAAPAESRVIVAALELEACLQTEHAEQIAPSATHIPARPVCVRPVRFAADWIDCPFYRRAELGPAQTIAGPAIVVEEHATTVVEPGWSARTNPLGHLLLSRTQQRPRRVAASAACDPMLLEVFGNRFMHIAEAMGIVLQHTARSVNIRERLDFSCAIFDGRGELIANAPHIPVHLGSMGDTVTAVLARHGSRMRPGDSYVSNAPYEGGTHLPDVTVVTPLWLKARALPCFVVACRAHHADLGGITPGSMPAQSRSIEQEGVLFEHLRLVADGSIDRARLQAVLTGGPHPARNPEQNIADLAAQLAANQRGCTELARLAATFTLPVVEAYMGHLKRNAEDCIREVIAKLDDGEYSLTLDGGERISVRIEIDRRERRALLDFSGCSPTSDGNFNAPAAVTRAAVLYAFRTLVPQNIPLNAGCFKPLVIRLPRPSLVDPLPPAAVVAGNVETSQCIVDALLAALGACAAAQGTMNNLSFGTARYQYYETIGGGAGAGPGFDGASAVQTHMTNSRLTDTEVLELLYPVRVRQFAIRRGSGGPGRQRGGDGIVRELEFLESMQVAILSNRRRTAAFGLAGGLPGRPGRNHLLHADGRSKDLGSTAERAVEPGARLLIETPGGGGYGPPAAD